VFYRPKRKYLPGFVPPKQSKPIIWLCKALLGMIMAVLYDITTVRVKPEDMARLKAFAGQRMVLLPNHPSHGDPAVLFRLSKEARENWFYLSNREQFDRWFGLYGRLLQQCGTYSVARGTLDMESFLTTRRLLVEKPNKLVIFAEGGNYSWNDLEAPFQEGLFRLLEMATDEMRAKSISEPLWVQPVALKYVYGAKADRQITVSLERLERAVGLEGPSPKDFRERVLRIGEKVVSQVEKNLFGKNFLSEDLTARIIRIREEMLHRFAQSLGTDTPKPESGTLLERTRTLFDQFHRVSLEGVIPKTQYEQTLFEADTAAKYSVKLQLDRLENWAALREGYLEGANRSRRVEILSRLEREVFKVVYLRPFRRCVVRLGEPFDLMAFAPIGAKTQKEIARAATREAEDRVRSLLLEMRDIED
jgi:1-acyl-sn-glycerol-3-phosphate acyltransferase